jgi:hypothetical protein
MLGSLDATSPQPINKQLKQKRNDIPNDKPRQRDNRHASPFQNDNLPNFNPPQ